MTLILGHTGMVIYFYVQAPVNKEYFVEFASTNTKKDFTPQIPKEAMSVQCTMCVYFDFKVSGARFE